MVQTPLLTLTVRELISLLAQTEERLHRARDGQQSTDQPAEQVSDLVRQQHQVIRELRRRRQPAT